MPEDKIPLDGDSEIDIERDEDGSAVNTDLSKAPPVKSHDIYPPLKEGETL